MDKINIQKTVPSQPPIQYLCCQRASKIISMIRDFAISLFSKIKDLFYDRTIPDVTQGKKITAEQFSKKIIAQVKKIESICQQIENKTIQDTKTLFAATQELEDLSKYKNRVKEDCKAALKELEKAEARLFSVSAPLFETVFEKALKKQDLVDAGKVWLDLENTNGSGGKGLEKEIEKVGKHVAELFLKEETLDDFVQAPPVGIPNIGNSCYLNSSCQVIFSSKSLMKRLFSPEVQLKNPNAQALRKALQKLAVQYYIAQKSGLTAIEKPFTEEIRNILFIAGSFPIENIYDQQCAGECLCFFAESLGIENFPVATTRSGKIQPGSSSPILEQNTTKESEGMLIIPIDKKEPPLFTPIWSFFAEFISTQKTEPKKTNSLELKSLLENFCNSEQLENWDGYPCYDEKKRIQKTAPDLLIIQCKRGQKDGGKLMERIKAPDELDISSIMETENVPAKYRLQAHISHHGASGFGGHYTAYVSKKTEGSSAKWHYISDSTTHCSKTEAQDRHEATIYIYEKIDK